MRVDCGIHLRLPKINWFVYPSIDQLQKCPKESCLLHLCNSAQPFEHKACPKLEARKKKASKQTNKQKKQQKINSAVFRSTKPCRINNSCVPWQLGRRCCCFLLPLIPFGYGSHALRNADSPRSRGSISTGDRDGFTRAILRRAGKKPTAVL